MISLRAVDQSNYRECIDLTVAPDQERFVASNLQSLADAYVYRDGAEPYAVYSEDEMIGFVLLYPLDERRGFIIVRLMIDRRFQGRGYGRGALEAIIELLRGRGLSLVRLSVVPANQQALEFYRRNGFVETGELEEGELVMERQL